MGNQICHCNIDAKHQTQELNFLKEINKDVTFSPSAYHGNAFKISQKEIDEVAIAYQSADFQGMLLMKDSNRTHSRSAKAPTKVIEILQESESKYGVSKWLTPNKECIFEGELLKCNVNCINGMISRYCQLKDGAFKYYKNHIHATTWLSKPLFQIPTVDIIEVRMYYLT
jgi:hypothetical protein